MYFGGVGPIAYDLYFLCCVQQVSIKLFALCLTFFMLMLMTIYFIV